MMMYTMPKLVRAGRTTLDVALPLTKVSSTFLIRLTKWVVHLFPSIRPTPATLMRIGVDALLINLAFLAALALRFLCLLALEVSPETPPYWNFLTEYAKHAGLLTLICLGIFYLSGFYSKGW